MTEKKKVLFVTQEMEPYTAISEISTLVRKLPEAIQAQGMEIRVLMPRFGTINERRHRLHEVVRLSGMNIIVDDDDFPLIIKVASLPGARLQVYFLDNEDFFKRKTIFTDEKGVPHADNPERMIFFCKGVIEIVRKFGWPPDIIHCHGWMTALVPFFIREAYKTEPLFHNSKIIYSLYNTIINQEFGESFLKKAAINALSQDDLSAFVSDGKVDLYKGAVAYADALIKGSEEMKEDIQALIASADKPVLDFQNDEQLQAAYINFYNMLLEEAVSSE
ncbi:MAG: glycogen/starch synthase [Saprospiraceae bacterium]